MLFDASGERGVHTVVVLFSPCTSPVSRVVDEILYLNLCFASAILCLFLFKNLSVSVLLMSHLTAIFWQNNSCLSGLCFKTCAALLSVALSVVVRLCWFVLLVLFGFFLLTDADFLF